MQWMSCIHQPIKKEQLFAAKMQATSKSQDDIWPIQPLPVHSLPYEEGHPQAKLIQEKPYNSVVLCTFMEHQVIAQENEVIFDDPLF